MGDILGGGGGDFSACTQPENEELSPDGAPGNRRDPVCAGGSDPSKHVAYFEEYTNDAAAWVKVQL
ncbi:hypothetical protein F5X99DRAFT_405348 [Biscogniauxia marginata]|nr:hypothetical protein F5X99DRAFT_405348 [Biscogniauxia marginata]